VIPHRLHRILLVLVVLLLALPAAAQEAEDGAAPTEAEPANPVAKKRAVVETLESDLDALKKDRDQVEGEERAGIETRLAERSDELRSHLAQLVELVGKAKDDGKAVDEALVVEVRALLQRDDARIGDELKRLEGSLASLRGALSKAEPKDRMGLESELSASVGRSVTLLASKLANAENRRELGADVTVDLKRLDDLLKERARSVASRITAATKERERLRARPASTDDERAARQRDLDLVEARLGPDERALRTLIDLLKRRELAATEYQQLLIESTGRITKDVLDADVTVGLLGRWLTRAEEWALSNAPQAVFGLVLFLLILCAAKLMAALTRRVVQRFVDRTELPQLARDFAVGLSGKAVIALGVVVGLSQMGVAMGPLVAGLGVAGFIVGFALQETLSNFASGIMILIYRPYDVGDLIEVASISGVVDKMTLVSTAILTLDNRRLVVPNNKIWNNVICNVTAEKTRRVDFTFGIGYGDDIDHAERILHDIIDQQEMLLSEPEPIVAVHELGDSSVNFVVRVWTETEQYWDVHWAMTREVKRRFDAEGISIPFPQRDVHLFREAS
jgi:small conductance mechanosensitive channel